MTRLVLAACALALVVPRGARADQPVEKGDIVVETPGERSLDNELVVGGVAGAGVIVSALGVYFHLDGRSAADKVSADSYTGKAWTTDKNALVDRADRDRTRAIACYSVGGALLVGAIVAWIITEPKSSTTVIHPHGLGSPSASLSPTDGGALVGGTWSF